MTVPDWDAMVLVGRIVRPHGNRGQVMVAPETDFAEARFAPGATVWFRREGQLASIAVTESRMHDGRPIIGLAGVESINDAETFRGRELRVPDEALPKLGDGQFWYHELIGCQVVTVSGQNVGHVVRIDGGSTDLLVVLGASGEVLVPMIDQICRRIDVAGRKIEIEPIQGLLDVNVRKAKAPEEAKGGKRHGR
ncbi:MAG: 16S rRNA processing protein RimM [Acidobacteria bacterium 37-65-4]|nr:MAG: 16S rRNA processing protein RimM [Acidobacteria bacterium 37-65-4]